NKEQPRIGTYYFANEEVLNKNKESYIEKHAYSQVCARQSSWGLGCAEYKKNKKKNYDELVNRINEIYSKKTLIKKGDSLKTEKVLVRIDKTKKGSDEEIKADVR